MKASKPKAVLIVLLILIIVFIGYVEIANRNSKQMTYRQKLLKAVYPALMWINKVTGRRSKVMDNTPTSAPSKSLYDLHVILNNGDTLKLATLKGKKILLVNTASDCGYTNQYSDLQKLL